MNDMFLRTKEQEKIIGKIGGIANVYYRDLSEACHTITQSLFENIVQNKSSIIVVANEDEGHMLQYSIRELGLDPITLAINLDGIINTADTDHLRSKFGSVVKSLGNEEMKEFSYNLINNDLISYHQNFKNLTTLGKTWNEVLADYVALKPSDRVFMLHAEMDIQNFDFNEEELASLRESISDALYLYQRDFEMNDSSMTAYGIRPGTQILDRLQDVTHDLFSFKEIAEDMRDKYYTCLHDIEHEQWNSSTASIKKLEEGLDLIAFKANKLNLKLQEKPSRLETIKSFIITDNVLVEKKASLITDLNAIVNVLQEKQILKADIQVLKFEDVISSVEVIRDIVSEWKQKLRKTIASNLKSSNKLNFNNHRLMDLETDLQALILRINQAEIFDGPFELNTLSFKKQIEFVTQLVYEIEVIMMKIEQNIQYYQWVSFLTEQDPKAQKLIQILKKFDPREWSSVFEMWYLYEVLNQAYPFGKRLDTQIIEKSNELKKSWFVERIDKIVSAVKAGINDSLKSLKTENHELYKVLTKKENFKNQVYWKHLIQDSTSFFSTQFPILIVEEDDLKGFKSDCYTELFYLNSELGHHDILQNFKTIHSYFPEEINQNSKECETLSNFRLDFEKPMDQIATTERLKYSKMLANNLVFFHRQPSVYQLKSATIISYGSEFIDQKLLDAFYSHGIKNICIDDSIYETIIACLLEEKKIILITEDYLLSKVEFDDYLYQYHTISQSVKAGFIHLNIDSKELFDSSGETLDTMIDAVKFNNGIVVDYKKQFSLEFI